MKHILRSNKNDSFTLIELLVVLSIIMTLVSLMVPALKVARLKMLERQCLSNQSQLGIAFALYSADNNGLMPYTAHTETINVWYASNGVLPYALYGESIEAPADRGVLIDTIFNCPLETDHPHWGYGQIYAYNASLNPGTGTGWKIGLRPNRRHIMRPSDAALLVESYDTAHNYWTFYTVRGDWLTGHHEDGINVLYLDGRVNWMDLMDIPTEKEYFWDAFEN